MSDSTSAPTRRLPRTGRRRRNPKGPSGVESGGSPAPSGRHPPDRRTGPATGGTGARGPVPPATHHPPRPARRAAREGADRGTRARIPKPPRSIRFRSHDPPYGDIRTPGRRTSGRGRCPGRRRSDEWTPRHLRPRNHSYAHSAHRGGITPHDGRPGRRDTSPADVLAGRGRRLRCAPCGSRPMRRAPCQTWRARVKLPVNASPTSDRRVRCHPPPSSPAPSR